MDKFLESLDKEIVKAAKDFETAKADAIRELQAMDVFTAVNYGAGYATKIDAVTMHASRLYHLNQMYRRYKYMTENNEK